MDAKNWTVNDIKVELRKRKVSFKGVTLKADLFDLLTTSSNTNGAPPSPTMPNEPRVVTPNDQPNEAHSVLSQLIMFERLRLDRVREENHQIRFFIKCFMILFLFFGMCLVVITLPSAQNVKRNLIN